MKYARWFGWPVVLLATTAGGVGVGYWYAGQQPVLATPAANPPPGGPVVKIGTQPIRQGPMEETLTSYGTVVAAPGELQTISESFETRVRQVLVTVGQSVDTATPLIEIEASPDTQLRLEQARRELESARESQHLTQESIDLKLATKQDLLVVQQRFQNAQLAFNSMTERGIGKPQVLKAAAPGLVMRIDARQGQIVAAGGSLLEMVGQNRINVRLGIENEDITLLHVGQPVRIIPVHQAGGQVVEGTVRLITQQVNLQTRLTDVFVAPTVPAQLMLNEYVRSEIVVRVEQALIAPRSAVLPEQDHFVLYTVEHGQAVKHTLDIGIENDRDIQLVGGDLTAGQLAVVSGNSELQDGMLVQSEPAP
ncbi:MAG: efflux RND transporter periplasmic adaptor subunit [Pirellulaceae bacterium]